MTSTQLIAASDLEFDFADRLRKALRLANMNATQLAEEMQVHRNATNSWINGKHMPRPRDIKLAAEITGVPVEWLVTGKAPAEAGACTCESEPPIGLEPITCALQGRDFSTAAELLALIDGEAVSAR